MRRLFLIVLIPILVSTMLGAAAVPIQNFRDQEEWVRHPGLLPVTEEKTVFGISADFGNSISMALSPMPFHSILDFLAVPIQMQRLHISSGSISGKAADLIRLMRQTEPEGLQQLSAMGFRHILITFFQVQCIWMSG